MSLESEEGAKQTAQLVEEMARTAQKMADNVQSANASVIDMAASIETISKIVDMVNNRAINHQRKSCASLQML